MKYYETTDLAEATFLRIEGYQLLKVEFDAVRRSAVFCFRDDNNLTETAAARYSRSSEGRRIHDVIRIAVGVLVLADAAMVYSVVTSGLPT